MSYSEIESSIKDAIIKLRPEISKKIKYPEIGEYSEGKITQQIRDELKNSVETDHNLDRLFELLLISKTSEISFIASVEDDVSVFILDGTEGCGIPSINFGLPKRFFFPQDGDKSLEFHITKLIDELYVSVINTQNDDISDDDNIYDSDDNDDNNKVTDNDSNVLDIDDIDDID